MKIISLLSFLGATALVPSIVCAAQSSAGVGPSFKGPIGLQLYSLRADFSNNVPDTLAKVRGFGFKDVELAGTYNLTPEKFKALLAVNGLKPVSGHLSYDRYREDVDEVAVDVKATRRDVGRGG